MYSRILVAVDDSPPSEQALQEAVRLARLCGARIRLLHVVNPLSHITGSERPDVYLREIRPAILRDAQKFLDQKRAALLALGLDVEMECVETHDALAANTIVQQIDSWSADLVVLGTQGRHGIGQLLLGSNAEKVASVSTVPVLLVRARPG